MAGRRYFGFVIGGSLPAALAANWLAGAWDQCPGLFAASPIGAAIEEVALGWLLDVLNLPAGTAGGFVTGATVANFTALAAARQAVLERAGWDVEADGLFGAPAITVIVGEEAHSSLIKALGMLGLGRSRVVRVPADGQGRMRAGEMPQIEGPAIVCMQSGNVNTGAFDPAEEICDRAHGAGAWVHVDGAFGLWAAASPRYAHLVRGVGRADSWATDAHKWLNVPYDSGLALVREPRALNRAMSVRAAYLPQSEHREPSQYTPELSRRARGVEIWAALRSLGRSGLAELIERNCRQARRFAEALEGAGFEILNEVVLNQVLVSAARRRRRRRSSRCSGTGPAGAARRSGRERRRCGSAFRPGRRGTKTWSGAWKRWCGRAGPPAAGFRRRDGKRRGPAESLAAASGGAAAMRAAEAAASGEVGAAPIGSIAAAPPGEAHPAAGARRAACKMITWPWFD
jgi:glutamate/tyrosine decarboxylase-like PLP-dependent enzyme